MKQKDIVLGIAGLWGVNTIISYFEKKKLIMQARKFAERADKPILNLGCGWTEYGDINADIVKQPVKNFIYANAEDLSVFEDKEFSVVFASHIIEHLENPEKVIKEMKRIADKVILIYPPLYAPGTYLTVSHKWLVTKKDNKLNFIKYNPLIAYGLLGLILLNTRSKK